MSLLTQAYILETYGPRLDSKQIAEVLGITVPALHNQISDGTCPVKTYKQGGRTWADYRDVSESFDRLRELAA